MARASTVLLSVFFWAIITISAAQFVSDNLKVTLKHGGVLVGRHSTSHHGRNVRTFLGIPYAKPPLENLRFSAPVPADAWDGVRLADKDANSCPQIDMFFNVGAFIGNEDCLYLNVYVPEEPKSDGPLPVMVWIHGGGFVSGTGVKAFYNPKLLMDRDIILVSINYRLTTLGFLSSETVDLPGNFGLKDQILALQWVQENIAAFGGNPNSVTIFGESAGGASVGLLTISDRTKGLFHRAIAESGIHYNTCAEPAPKGYAASLATKVAEKVGCGNDTTSWSEKIHCLRKVDFKTLTEMGTTFLEWGALPIPVFPIVVEPEHESAFLTKNVGSTNFSNSVPQMIGYNSDEGYWFMSFMIGKDFSKFKGAYEEHAHLLMDYRLSSPEYHPMIKSSIKQFYFPNDSDELQSKINVFTDAWIFSGVDKHIRDRLAVKENAAPTYLYSFENNGLSAIQMFNESYIGSTHVDELLYLFPLNELFTPRVAPTKRDWQLREHMLDIWTNFAAQGNPTPEDSKLPKWTAVDRYPPKMYQIGNKEEGGPLLHMSDKYPTARADFWQGLEPYLVKKSRK